MEPASKLYEKLASSPIPYLREGEPGHYVTSGLANGGGELYLFEDQSGRIGLFVPFGTDDPHAIRNDTKSKYISLRTVGFNGAKVIEVRLEAISLRNVFFAFADTFFSSFQKDPESAAEQMAGQLQSWRVLFLPASRQRLSTAQEIGLICELQEMLLLLATDGKSAFYQWTGPDNQRHDFRFADRNIECKATTVQAGLKVSINGLSQLEPEPNGPLLLAVRKYEPTPNGDISLKAVVNDLLAHPKIPKDEFLLKLKELGYTLDLDTHETDPVEHHYRLVQREVFEVGSSFPLLRADNPSPRISNVQYSLDLAPAEEVDGHRENGHLFC